MNEKVWQNGGKSRRKEMIREEEDRRRRWEDGTSVDYGRRQDEGERQING